VEIVRKGRGGGGVCNGRAWELGAPLSLPKSVFGIRNFSKEV